MKDFTGNNQYLSLCGLNRDPDINEAAEERRKIDAGGLSQFYTGYKEQSPTLLLEYTLKEAIDPERLQAAVEKAADVFSVFRHWMNSGSPYM